ncbi:MAG: hypothetical protein H6Q89_373 [Myxococcaceae bacterium]|nr:hypothetical protein [Myxococcaceae bacterium]
MKPTPAAYSLDGGKLLMLVAFLALGIVGWDWQVLWPFKLLAVMGHETGHALASLLAGGSVSRVSIAGNESGECLSAIPTSFLARTVVYSAGYVGSAIVSVVLLLCTFRFDLRRFMLGAACVWLSVMGLLYARDAFTLAFCFGMAISFGLGARFLPAQVVGVLNLFIASFTALYAAMDLKDDLWNGAVRVRSDAQLLADITPIPSLVWAALWTLLSTALLAVGVYVAMRRRPTPLPMTTRLPDQLLGRSR